MRSKKNWITRPMVSSVMIQEINLPYLLVFRAARSTFVTQALRSAPRLVP